jgi:hypothetical protein
VSGEDFRAALGGAERRSLCARALLCLLLHTLETDTRI